jgi:DNA-binding IclR family transcriptional regulator
MQLLLSAHPNGLVVGEIQGELGIPGSTLSHHLDKLKNEGLVSVRREGTFLWYTANTEALQELLGFLYAECCTRNKAIQPEKIAAFDGQVAEAAVIDGQTTVAIRSESSCCSLPAACDRKETAKNRPADTIERK